MKKNVFLFFQRTETDFSAESVDFFLVFVLGFSFDRNFSFETKTKQKKRFFLLKISILVLNIGSLSKIDFEMLLRIGVALPLTFVWLGFGILLVRTL